MTALGSPVKTAFPHVEANTKQNHTFLLGMPEHLLCHHTICMLVPCADRVCYERNLNFQYSITQSVATDRYQAGHWSIVAAGVGTPPAPYKPGLKGGLSKSGYAVHSLRRWVGSFERAACDYCRCFLQLDP